MIEFVVYLAILVILAILGWWLLQQVALPEPLGKIVQIVFVVVIVVVLIILLLNLAGMGGIKIPR